MLEEHKLLFILLTETWLRDQVDAELSIKNYTLFRVDRSRAKKRRGRNSGGVAAYIRNDIVVEVMFEYSNGVIEALCLNLKKLNLIIGVVYRPPDDPTGGNRSTNEEFSSFVDKLNEELTSLPSPTPNIILAGDFNMPHASWPSGNSMPGASPEERLMIQTLSNFSEQHFLIQMNDQPTHRAGNILDLLFTNCPDYITSIESTPSAPISSHHLVTYTTVISTLPSLSNDNLSDNPFDGIDLYSDETKWTEIRTALSETSWIENLQNLHPSDILSTIKDKCHTVVQTYAPKKRKKSKNSPIPRHRRTLMRKRTRIRKSYHASSNPCKKQAAEAKLVEIERQLQESYRSQEQYDEDKAIRNIRANTKYFYSYAQKKSKIRIPVGPLTDSMGNMEGTAAGMANILSKQYETSFSNPAAVVFDASFTPSSILEDISFTEEDIKIAINEVSNNAAPGPDGFPAILLRNCENELARPLHILWRKSLDSGEIPDELKKSNIKPVHKGGSRHIAKNYRPVALTSHLIKIFEKVVRCALVKFIEENDLMNPNQHGFRAGHSCLSQLLQHHDRITQLLEEGWNADVIYLDFSKAFDKLDIGITLQKLHDMGIRGKVFQWIKSFLMGRKQCVLVEGQKSEQVSVRSGVPQGSVVGPLMFLILLRDIDNDVTLSHVASFADDTRVLSGIRNSEDVAHLQSDLEKIFGWADMNNATFNPDKFECVRYGMDDTIKQSTAYTSSGGTTIQSTKHVRDLGVTLSDDATFTEHITRTAKSASLMCGWILRTFKTRERLPLITLWKALVSPVLDYCSQLWSPSTPGLIQSLETVQSSFFKKIVGLYSLDYWEQLKSLKMSSLQRRRERYTCIYVWKVLEGLVPNFGLQSNHSIRRGRSCNVPAVKRAGSHRHQTIRFNSLGVLGPRLFNHLPARIRDMTGCSVDSFKRALDKHLDTVPDQPRLPKLVRFCTKGSNCLLEYSVNQSNDLYTLTQ